MESARLSPAQDLQRTWSAVVHVDASRCATPSGRFAVEFVRLKENAPDLPFTEHFAWTPGRVEIALDLWADEAILDYAVGAAGPCACRK